MSNYADTTVRTSIRPRVDEIFIISKLFEKHGVYEISLRSKDNRIAYLFLNSQRFSRYRKLVRPESKIRILEADRIETENGVNYYYLSYHTQLMLDLDRLVRVTDVLGKDAARQWLLFNRGIEAPRLPSAETGWALHKFAGMIIKESKDLCGRPREEIHAILRERLQRWLIEQPSADLSVYYAPALIDSIASILTKIKTPPEIFLIPEYTFVSPEHGLIGQVDFLTVFHDGALIEEYYFSNQPSIFPKEMQAAAYCVLISKILNMPLDRVEARIRTFRTPETSQTKPGLEQLLAIEPLEPAIVSGEKAWSRFRLFARNRNILLRRIADRRMPQSRKPLQQWMRSPLFREYQFYRNYACPNELEKVVNNLLRALEAEIRENYRNFISVVTEPTTEEMEVRGYTYLNLTLDKVNEEDQSVVLRSERTLSKSIHLNEGAHVRVASMDAPLHGYRVGEIGGITDDHVTVALNNEITPVLTNAKKLRVDFYPYLELELRFKRALAFLELGYSGQSEHHRIRRTLAEYLINSSILPQLTPIDYQDPDLDDSQARAVGAALGAEKLCYLLVHGPPGTGKTYVASRITAEEFNKGSRILLAAHNNHPVDHLLKELPSELRKYAVRIGNRNKVDEQIAKEMRILEPSDDSPQAVETVRSTRIVAVTTSSVASRLFSAAFNGYNPFDVCILDEATQCTTPSALLPLCYSWKWIMLGDHKQLNPVVISKEAGALKRTLFKQIAEFAESQRQDLICSLAETRRLPALTTSIASLYVYRGKLSSKQTDALKLSKDPALIRSLIEQYDLLLKKAICNDLALPAKPISSFLLHDGDACMLDICMQCFEEEHLGSYRNPLSSVLSLLVAEGVQKLAGGSLDIKVITPYDAQVVYTKTLLDGDRGKLKISVNSVDAIQGEECDVTVLDLVRCNALGAIGFLELDERINVAFTRHKKKAYVIGDLRTLTAHPSLAGSIAESLRLSNAIYRLREPTVKLGPG